MLVLRCYIVLTLIAMKAFSAMWTVTVCRFESYVAFVFAPLVSTFAGKGFVQRTWSIIVCHVSLIAVRIGVVCVDHLDLTDAVL